MKQILLIIALICSFNVMFAQAPMRNYGEYKYVYSLDRDGDKIEATAFPRIKPSVVTTNFFGITQSQASYMYMGIGGMWQNSATYDWSGYRNGWYVYTFRMGVQYCYFLISQDYEQVRIQENYQNGITNVYKRCNPNEKMDNAPTY
jgi:hypothetical protein